MTAPYIRSVYNTQSSSSNSLILHLIRVLTAPVCAAVEVYLVNKELWSSQIPRINALMVSIISITLFPIWYFSFLAAIFAAIYDTEGTKISSRDKRIIYNHQKDTKFPLQKSLMVFVFLIFSPIWFLTFCDHAIGAVIYTIIRNRKKVLTRKGKSFTHENLLKSIFLICKMLMTVSYILYFVFRVYVM